jgi:hypothetical protein
MIHNLLTHAEVIENVLNAAKKLKALTKKKKTDFREREKPGKKGLFPSFLP